MSFPYKVGDRIRRDNWAPNEFTTISAIGTRRFLAHYLGNDDRDEVWYNQTENFVPYVDQKRWTITTERKVAQDDDWYLFTYPEDSTPYNIGRTIVGHGPTIDGHDYDVIVKIERA